MSRNFLFVLASTRREGNSEALARTAALGLGSECTQRWLRLVDHPLPAFVDTRHGGGYAPPEGNAKWLCEATLEASDLVIVTPVYWYSLPWPAKLYLDHWSAWMRIPELDFRRKLQGRNLWAVVVDSDAADEGSADPVVDTLRRTAEYLSMRWRGALLGHANRPGEWSADARALAAAGSYFSRPASP